MYLKLNFSPRVLLKQAFSDRSKLDRKLHQHYTRVFPGPSERHGPLEIGKSLVGASDWYQSQWVQLDRIAGKPFLILWGIKDAFIRPENLKKWKNRLIQSKTRTFPCGHFLQEEVPNEVTEAIQAFVTQP